MKKIKIPFASFIFMHTFTNYLYIDIKNIFFKGFQKASKTTWKYYKM